MTPIRVVAGALVRDGRLMAAQRGSKMSQGGLWELPGGKVNPEETDPEALTREWREELGVEIDVFECFGCSTYTYPDKVIELVGYRCAVVSGVPVALEHDQLRWVSGSELDGLAWAPADLPLIGLIRTWLSP